MKKLAISLCILAFSGVTFAYYFEDETPHIDTLRGQGYSESTIQAVDTTARFNQGKNVKSGSYYSRRKGKNAFGRSYTSIKNYLDPMQDDGQFGQHQIQFTNTWNGDTPFYAKKYNTEYNNENL